LLADDHGGAAGFSPAPVSLSLHRCQFLTHFVITLSWSGFLAACKAQIRILLLPQGNKNMDWVFCFLHSPALHDGLHCIALSFPGNVKNNLQMGDARKS